MSYYITKRVQFTDAGIQLEVADSNLYPRTYFKDTYGGSVTDFLKSIYEGNFMLLGSVGKTLLDACDNINDIIKKLVVDAGLSFEDCLDYKIPERTKAIETICNWFAARFDKSLSVASYSDMLAETGAIVAQGKENLKAQKEVEAENGIINISCAGYAIFENYDVLIVKGKNIAVLAPRENYACGKLKTDPERDFWVPEELGDLWSFLSFTGVDITLEDFIRKEPGRESEIRERFSNADKAVELALAAGLELRDGVTPYRGWTRC